MLPWVDVRWMCFHYYGFGRASMWTMIIYGSPNIKLTTTEWNWISSRYYNRWLRRKIWLILTANACVSAVEILYKKYKQFIIHFEWLQWVQFFLTHIVSKGLGLLTLPSLNIYEVSIFVKHILFTKRRDVSRFTLK